MIRHWILLPILLTGQALVSADTLGPAAPALSEVRERYQGIRNAGLDPNLVIECDSLRFARENGEFQFCTGSLFFYQPLDGRPRMAYFQGDADFQLTSNLLIEQYQLKRFSGKDTVRLKFKRAWFAFTDDAFEVLSKSVKPSARTVTAKTIGEAAAFRTRLREFFPENIDARLLQDWIDPGPAGFFQIYFEASGQDYAFTVDLRDEEEISLVRYERPKRSKRAGIEIWFMGRPLLGTGAAAEVPADIFRTDLEARIDAKEKLSVTADVHFTCRIDRRRVFRINLSPYLRVETAVLDSTDTCQVIQEDKEKDGELWIICPTPLAADREYSLKLVYSGTGIIDDIGGDNYVIQARSVWFPTFYPALDDPAVFHIRYEVPKGLTVLSTGERLRVWDEGEHSYSEWTSGRESVRAGFNYGKFSRTVNRDTLCEIECCTNTKLSDDLTMIRRIIENNNELQAELMLLPQELTTEKMGRNAAIESGNAYRVYHHFFGPIPIERITVSQQPQSGFGQSWPTLIYLPFTAFFEPSVLERLGIFRAITLEGDVASHEIAHQWWGHTVFNSSYHDEWLSEGFATYSAALFYQAAKGTSAFRGYMDLLNKEIRVRSEKGRPAYELGPIWLGRRLNSLAQPSGYNLIYSKGAYVLHMLRMMLFDFQTKSDEKFIAMMTDWVNKFSGRIATTRDFKELVSLHFGRNMDWFFKQWVYGTSLPVYFWSFKVEPGVNGAQVLKLRVRQEGVPPDFRMPLPFMINFDQGYAVTVVEVSGTEPVTKEIVCAARPKSIEPNIWYSVLCEIRKGD
jgi:hypothetical protein